jgi:segregation and condensation protein A
MATATRDPRASAGAASLPAPEPDAASVAPYTVRLPGFEGPLDLLLHLIEKNQLEITTISLVAVTDQFIEYIHAWDHPPLPRMAEFVAMAARLLLIKSRSLLPRQSRQDETNDEPDPLEDAEMLRRHLIEYKAAREIARALRAREAAGMQTFARLARMVEPETLLAWSPPQIVGVSVEALAMVFRRVLLEKRLSEPEALPLPIVTVAEKIAEVEALLAAHGCLTLEEALRTADSRFAVVVTFLAILELWHQARIIARQETLFGPIEILPGPKFGQRVESSSFDPGPLEAAITSPQAVAPSVAASMAPAANPNRQPATRRKGRRPASLVQPALDLDESAS